MKTKIILISLITLVAGLIVAGVVYGVSRYRSMVVRPIVSVKPDSTPTPTPDPDSPFSVLLLGYGGGTHQGGKLTDSIMLARFRPLDRQIDLISVPRDLWVEIPTGSTSPFFSKINAAYQIGGDTISYPHLPVEYTGPAGGGMLAKKVVADVTGISPDYFAAVDFSGFTRAIDVLGGVEVDVQKSFSDKMYPVEGLRDDPCGKTIEDVTSLTATLSGLKLEEQFPCRYEVLEFTKGITHMDGATALKYVRSRHSSTDGGDFNRAARQRQFVLAIRNKILTVNFFPKIIPLLNTISSHVQTDVDLPQLERYLGRGLEFSGYRINSIALTGENVLTDGWSSDRQAILMPQEGIGRYQKIHQYITTQSQ